ncbi:MAG TPA: aminotransferase class V-fold PLP-dependent enzyme, partial [Acidimicrobiales bacterium]|nr:aminotransferase class V-fold PLP-dependent enzyme [Acidimicrobiales bacterium]
MVLTDRVLMGPGPCNPYPEATAGLSRPMLGHLDPEFIGILDETCDRLRSLWKTANPVTLPVSGTGSAGMEAALVNLVGPGDTVVVGVNGLFGERMCDVAARCGAEVVRVDFPWGRPVEPDALLSAHPSPKLIAVVHAETSTGVRNDIEAVAAGKGDALLLADCVT